jgi:hypothetical protein
VVYQDIILGPTLAEVARYYLSYPLHVIVLCPAVEVVAAREAGRSKTGYSASSDIAVFDRILRTKTPRLGLWLDTSTWIHLDEGLIRSPVRRDQPNIHEGSRSIC